MMAMASRGDPCVSSVTPPPWDTSSRNLMPDDGPLHSEKHFTIQTTEVDIKAKGLNARLRMRDQGMDEFEDGSGHSILYQRFRPWILGTCCLITLGWWISSTVLLDTRHRWIPQTFWSWFFILTMLSRVISYSVIDRFLVTNWHSWIIRPIFSLSYRMRLTFGWLALVALVFGSAFGFPLSEGTSYGDRIISVVGLCVFQFGFYLTSVSRSNIRWHTIVVGLFFQHAIALFALKSKAGFDLFRWIAALAQDFLGGGSSAATFFVDAQTVAKHWFFVSVLGTVMFFVAFVQLMYYFGIMQWVVAKCAWFFFKTMNISGAEAVVAAASPFFGQAESPCLVRPYVDLMTPSELHLTMVSGCATIAGSVLTAYINLGVPAISLITSSVMSVPASIAISKLRYPEDDEPVTRDNVAVDRGIDIVQYSSALHALSRGAVLGLNVAGQILANVLTILALLYTVNGLLTYIGQGFGIHSLTIEVIFGYVFYPLTFLMGVPRPEILRVSRLMGTKLFANEFVAYLELSSIQASSNPLSQRAFTIASYGLCGFANLGSLGIEIGVLSALAPSRSTVIARLAPSAVFCGFISTMQTAGIAGTLM